MARNEIRPLTGVRGLAALLVAVYHLNGPEAPDLLRVPGVAGQVVAHGYLAVDLFFVLSGYVIALSYGEMLRSWDSRSYLKFLIRRIARVYPLYAVVTLGTAWLIATGLSHEPIEHLPAALGFNLLMIQSWGFAPSLDGPAWSISTEWAAYLLFPMLAGWTLFGRPRAAAITGVIGAGAVVVMALLPSPETARNGPLDIYGPGISVARCVAEFSLGLIAFRLSSQPLTRRIAGASWFSLTLVALMAWLLTIHGSDLLLVALFPALVLALALGAGPVPSFFACAPVFLAGELSYAIYLLHQRFMRPRDILFAKLLPITGPAAAITSAVILYTGLLVASWLAYRLLERPARSFVRRAERLIPPARQTVPGDPAPADAVPPLSSALSPP